MTVPPGLAQRGQEIWASFKADTLAAPQRALVHELARSADTLDRLDALLVGRREDWLAIVFNDMGEVHLEVDKVLAERRQQQLAFKQLFQEIRQAGVKPGETQKPAEPDGRGGVVLALQRRTQTG